MDRKPNITYREEKLLQTIEISKAAFYEGEAAFSLSWWEFLTQQCGYIKKGWWVLQGTLLVLVLLLLQNMGSVDSVQRCLGVAAPLFVLLALPELWKNRNYNAMEVECTTFYSLRQIYAARMTLFAGMDLTLLSLFFCCLSFTSRLTVWDMLIQFVLPFNVTCCICFRYLYSMKTGSEVFSLLLCAVWTAIWVQIILYDAVYNAISVPLWCLMLILSFGYFGYTILQGQRKWEQTWEVNPLWN